MSSCDDDGTIDHSSVEWKGVISARYRIEQSLRYEYDAPIRNLRHQLIITPRARHIDQARVDRRLWSSSSVPLAFTTDRFGNEIASLSLARVEHEIAFGLESTIARVSGSGLLGAHGNERPNPRWMDVGRLTRADDAMFEIATELHARYPAPRERVQAIAAFVHRHMIYTKNVTDVFTTASTAFQMGRGVCQDFAHIAIALARATGLGARYASGHLLGEGATHAWVEFLVPDGERTVVVSLDPTYCTATDFRYVVIAIGRDYHDVPPTSGVFSGRASGTLFTQQRVCLTGLTYAA